MITVQNTVAEDMFEHARKLSKRASRAPAAQAEPLALAAKHLADAATNMVEVACSLPAPPPSVTTPEAS